MRGVHNRGEGGGGEGGGGGGGGGGYDHSGESPTVMESDDDGGDGGVGGGGGVEVVVEAVVAVSDGEEDVHMVGEVVTVGDEDDVAVVEDVAVVVDEWGPWEVEVQFLMAEVEMYEDGFRRVQNAITDVKGRIRDVRVAADNELGYQWLIRLDLGWRIFGPEFRTRAPIYRDYLISLGTRHHRAEALLIRAGALLRERFERLRAFLERTGWGTGYTILDRLQSYYRECARFGMSWAGRKIGLIMDLGHTLRRVIQLIGGPGMREQLNH